MNVAPDFLFGSAVWKANALALQLRRSNVQRLRIGAAPYTKIMRQRRDLIERFTSLGTNTSLELETGWSLALIDRLKAGEIDLSFMMGSFAEDLFEGVCLRQVGVALTVANGHAFSGLASIEPDMLAGRSIQVFTRSLNPKLWDDLHAPLVAAGARFVEVPDMAEGAPDTMDDDQAIAAFFDFTGDEAPPVHVSRVRLSAEPRIPFSLLRRRSEASAAAATFWDTALRGRGPDVALAARAAEGPNTSRLVPSVSPAPAADPFRARGRRPA